MLVYYNRYACRMSKFFINNPMKSASNSAILILSTLTTPIPMSEKNKTILVVEDEQLVREIMIQELKEHGYKTLEASDGEIAIKLWQEKQPDLVLLDILLPKMDGFEIMKSMRSSSNDAPVIILSNLWRNEDMQKMFEYKIEDFLVKAHTTTEDVIKRIDNYFAGKK